MPETIALARLAISKNRMAIAVLIVWAVVAVTVTAAVSIVFQRQHALPVLIITTMPAAVWSLGLFDFGSGQDLMAGQSGYSRWLLRMPIANWKLALVPLALRTLWICVSWCLFVIAAKQLSGVQLPIGSAPALFCAMGVWVSVVSWRPFHSGWWRITAMLLTGVLFYVLMIFLFMTHFDNHTSAASFSPAAKLLIPIGGLAAFMVGINRALRAVDLARTNSDGLIPEFARSATGPESSAQFDVAPIREFRSPRWALAGHDLARLLVTNRRLAVILGSLYILVVALALPFNAATAAFVIFFSAYMSVCTAIGMLEQPERDKSSLPSYVAISPLTSAEIGFTRAITVLAFALPGLAVVALIFALWAIWPDNRSTFTAWVEQMTSQYGSPLAACRIIAVTLIASFVFFPSCSISYLATTLSGNTRLQMVCVAGPTLLFLGLIGTLCGWTLRQTDWESAIANAKYWASWLPMVGCVALAIKLVMVSIAAGLSRRHKLISAKTTMSIMAGWALGTLLLSLMMFWLIPDPRVLFWWCLLATALVIPLAPVLILPYSVYLNRHR